MTDSTYLHGSSPAEQDRLALMNELLNRHELALLAPRGDERCLELGAGTGLFAADLARALPDGQVVAIERDAEQLATARRHAAGLANLELRQGDACDPPLSAGERGHFDLVHARFLLEHLPRPQAAVDAMVAAVRPGGRVVLVDDDHSLLRLAPDCEPFTALWTSYWRHYERLGCDPNVGRRLVSLLVAGGARPTRTAWLPYGGCAGEPHFAGLVDNLVRVVDTARAGLVASGERDERCFTRDLQALRDWAGQPDATIWYALPCAEATRDDG